MKRLLAAVALAAMVGAGSSASASIVVPVYSTYDFTGLCFDCANPLGVLTLKNYALGDSITTSNFVSFSYSSSVLSFSITNPNSVSGSIATIPGPNDFNIYDDAHSFLSTSTLPWFWNVDNDGISADYGFLGGWSAAPEPASWALMVLGFGLAGATLRSRKRVSVAFA